MRTCCPIHGEQGEDSPAVKVGCCQHITRYEEGMPVLCGIALVDGTERINQLKSEDRMQDSGGNPVVDLGANHPPPEDFKIDHVHVLVCIHSNGGESIYGQMLGSLMVNFVTESDHRQHQMDELLLRQGTYNVAPKLGVRLEWRTYDLGP